MKRRFIYNKETDSMVEITEQATVQTHYVMPEIKAHRSMVDGSWIESRSQMREHHKRHGVRPVDAGEISGTYTPNYDVAPERRRELIRAQVDAMPHKEFKAALQRDIDNVKWNSRTR